MTFSKKIFISCLFVSLITVTSCGYSLKKSTNELSQKEIVVIADNSDLNLELIYQLKVKGNEITRSKEADNANNLILKIKFHKIDKFSGALGAGARTTQARLDYKITYELIPNNRKKIENTFTSTKYLNFNQADLLAMEREEKILLKNFISDGIKSMEFYLALNKNED